MIFETGVGAYPEDSYNAPLPYASSRNALSNKWLNVFFDTSPCKVWICLHKPSSNWSWYSRNLFFLLLQNRSGKVLYFSSRLLADINNSSFKKLVKFFLTACNMTRLNNERWFQWWISVPLAEICKLSWRLPAWKTLDSLRTARWILLGIRFLIYPELLKLCTLSATSSNRLCQIRWSSSVQNWHPVHVVLFFNYVSQMSLERSRRPAVFHLQKDTQSIVNLLQT